VTLIFDRLTLKLACESHLKRGTFIPNLGTLGLWVLEIFDRYIRNGQTDEQTDGRTKATLTAPSNGRWYNNHARRRSPIVWFSSRNGDIYFYFNDETHCML